MGRPGKDSRSSLTKEQNCKAALSTGNFPSHPCPSSSGTQESTVHPNSASNRGTKGKGMPCCSSRQGSGLGKASQPSSLEKKRTEGHPLQHQTCFVSAPSSADGAMLHSSSSSPQQLTQDLTRLCPMGREGRWVGGGWWHIQAVEVGMWQGVGVWLPLLGHCPCCFWSGGSGRRLAAALWRGRPLLHKTQLERIYL